jgi:hypothetical protein
MVVAVSVGNVGAIKKIVNVGIDINAKYKSVSICLFSINIQCTGYRDARFIECGMI